MSKENAPKDSPRKPTGDSSMNYPAIQHHETLKQTVDARTLWRELGSRRDFSSWIKAKVINNPFFEENTDYILLIKSGEQDLHGGHNRKDYALTLETAKKVAMAEQTVKGNDVRDYFIECEQKAQQPAALSEDEIVLQALTIQNKKIQALASQVAELEPKAKALDLIATHDGSLNITNAAKTLQVRPKKLFDFLSARKWIYRHVGGSSWVAYQDKLQQGVMEHKITTRMGGDGTERIDTQARITPKGIQRLSNIFAQDMGAMV